MTPLHWAAATSSLESITLLLDRGATLEAQDNNGDTALYWAARKGDLPTVTLLVDKDAHIFAKNNANKTALIIAQEQNHTEVADFLEQHIVEKPDNKER